MRRALGRLLPPLASAGGPRGTPKTPPCRTWGRGCAGAKETDGEGEAPAIDEFRRAARRNLEDALGEPLAARIAPHLPHSATGEPPPKIAVGISGGVDSAVTAWILMRAGYDVVGVLMRNWDEAEETGGECAFEKDQRDAAAVARSVGIELREVDFVKEYWHAVFQPFLRDFDGGASTPNPDLACNRHIKFGSLLKHCLLDVKADVLCTGHYAKIVRGPNGVFCLHTAEDKEKDQSYFLASVKQEALRNACFPLGWLTKTEVRAIAAGPAKLPSAVTSRRSSRGICFIGRKKNFGEFVHEYLPEEGRTSEASATDSDAASGAFVSVVDGAVVGAHKGLARYTCGQGARVGGASAPWFVVGKDSRAGVTNVYVAPGSDHPALFVATAAVARCFWVEGKSPLSDGLDGGRFGAKTRYGAEIVQCFVRRVPHWSAITLERGKYWRADEDLRREDDEESSDGGALQVDFDDPQRAITPGQALVLYDTTGSVCYGGGVVWYPGVSEHEKAT